MSPSLRLSVALATCNGERYLAEQLDSLAAQSRLPDELVVSDDRSDDGTLALVEAFAARVPFPVRILRNAERLGLIRNFEQAMRACTGDLVFLCDQDDVWLPAKLATVADHFERDPRLMVVLNDALLTDEQLVGDTATQLGNVRAAGFPDSGFNFGCCSAHRRRWQEIALPIPGEVKYHDWWVNWLAHRTGTVLVDDRVLQYYRRHGSNVTGWVLSGVAGVNRLKLFTEGRGRDMLADWRYQAQLRTLVANRIAEHAALLRDLTGRDPESHEASLRAEARAVEGRIHACSPPRWRRAARVYRHWRSGHYALYGSGWKSAVRDLLRP